MLLSLNLVKYSSLNYMSEIYSKISVQKRASNIK